MSLAIRLVPEICRSVGFASINGVYIGIGTAVTEPIRFLMLQNKTDADVMLSFDGVNDTVPLGTGTQWVWDITANKTTEHGFFLGQGTRIYVKTLWPGDVPTQGAVFLSTFYGAK
jgi:hypothetical protein